MQLPAELLQAIEAEVGAVAPGALRAAVERLSGRYRAREAGSDGRYLRGPEDVAAYVAYRMPATYGAVVSALEAAAEVLDERVPRSALDVGAGTGAASWAAVAVWPELEAFTLIDQDTGMLAAGRRIACHSPHAGLRSASWRAGRLDALPTDAEYDLVISAYVLNELDADAQREFVDRLWRCARQMLVIVDTGTPLGFAGVKAARRQLLDAGAHVVAPCPHGDACPLPDDDWCHFAARVERSRVHRAAKSGDKGFEDEKFSYLAVAREPVRPAPGRILRHPQIHKGYVQLSVCAPSGVAALTYSRRHGKPYKAARDARWGDVWDSEPGP